MSRSSPHLGVLRHQYAKFLGVLRHQYAKLLGVLRHQYVKLSAIFCGTLLIFCGTLLNFRGNLLIFRGDLLINWDMHPSFYRPVVRSSGVSLWSHFVAQRVFAVLSENGCARAARVRLPHH